MQLLNTKPPFDIHIGKDLDGVELSSTTKKLIRYFSQIPTDEHIYIIVQTPLPATTGKCLPMVYLSNKKFANLLLISSFFLFFPILPQRTTKEKKAPLEGKS